MSGVAAHEDPKRAAIARALEHEVAIEPVPGLPEELPKGERVLWSGAPDWKAFTYDALHLRAIFAYAAVIVGWRFAATLYDGGTMAEAVSRTTALGTVFLIGLGILAVLGLVMAKATRYTITNKRVVMRIGVALTLNINLPFREITSADYRTGPRKTGAIALSLKQSGGLGYAALWPHARPFKFSKPQPLLRCIKDGERVARILGTALAAAHAAEAVPQTLHVTTPAAKTVDPTAADSAAPNAPVAA